MSPAPDIRYCNRTPDMCWYTLSILITMFYTAITSYYGSTVVNVICIMCDEDWTCATLQYQCTDLVTSWLHHNNMSPHVTTGPGTSEKWCLILFNGHIFGVTSSPLRVNHNQRPGTTWHVANVQCLWQQQWRCHSIRTYWYESCDIWHLVPGDHICHHLLSQSVISSSSSWHHHWHQQAWR